MWLATAPSPLVEECPPQTTMATQAKPPVLITTEGIVIRTHASGDSNLVVKLMTPERGKLALFAKSARASSKNFRSGLEVFDLELSL